MVFQCQMIGTNKKNISEKRIGPRGPQRWGFQWYITSLRYPKPSENQDLGLWGCVHMGLSGPRALQKNKKVKGSKSQTKLTSWQLGTGHKHTCIHTCYHHHHHIYTYIFIYIYACTYNSIYNYILYMYTHVKILFPEKIVFPGRPTPPSGARGSRPGSCRAGCVI
jgi:hypothetical protein